MKKYLSFIFGLFLLVSSCSQEELLKSQSTNLPIITAGFEQNDSRTYIEEGKYLRWNENDQISFFYKSTLNLQYKFNGETGDNAGTFSCVNQVVGTGNDLEYNYAVYPYSDVKISESGIITATLPSEQSYATNSFGVGANTMVAATQNTEDTFLKFKNVGGYLKLLLYGDDVTVKSITLTGNNNEKLAGKATIISVYGQDPTIQMADDATKSITLDCDDGIKIGSTAETATAFWIVVPPTSFDNGFVITITDVNDYEVTKSTSNEISIERNRIKPMAAFKVETVETIPNNQIWYTSSNNDVIIPDANANFGAQIESNVYEKGKGIITFKNSITSIGQYAFSDKSSLTSITIPNSVEKIGYYAFAGTSLASITIPNNVTDIENCAFRGCSSLKSVAISNEVTAIGFQTFYQCSSLTNIIIRNSVITIDKEAFSGCSSLANIIIPNSVTTIGELAFSGCRSLNNVNIPNSVITIDKRAFYHCTSLTNITIPNSVNAIGEGAFYGCSSLSNITISNGVTSVKMDAFGYCTSLKDIVIPNSVTNIEPGVFKGCELLSSIKVENGNSVYDSRNNCNAIIETSSNTLISGCKKTIIPSNVTTIGKSAFLACKTLENISIPDNVTNIDYYAFGYCTSLESIVIPKNVTNIGGSAFYGCSSLAKVDVKATTPPVISYDTFKDCNQDIQIYVPAANIQDYKEADCWKELKIEIETIPNNQIWYTSSNGEVVTLTNKNFTEGGSYDSNIYVEGKGIVNFTGDVTVIGNSAFAACSTLTNVNIPNSVTWIDGSAFSGCTSLTGIIIPNNLTYIGFAAFLGCISLTNITIPNSVSKIDDYAFSGCTSLKIVEVNATVPPVILSNTFSGCNNDLTIYVPASSLEDYKKADYWKDLKILSK